MAPLLNKKQMQSLASNPPKRLNSARMSHIIGSSEALLKKKEDILLESEYPLPI